MHPTLLNSDIVGESDDIQIVILPLMLDDGTYMLAKMICDVCMNSLLLLNFLSNSLKKATTMCPLSNAQLPHFVCDLFWWWLPQGRGGWTWLKR